MNTLIELLLIAVVTVFIIDISGAKTTLLHFVSIWLHRDVQSLRPFTCSLCMTWWIGLLWLVLSHSCDLYGLAGLSLASALTRPIAGLFIFIIEALSALSDWLMDKLG